VPTVLPFGTQPLKATGKVNVYDLPADGILGNGGDLNLTLDRNNQSDPIFVFRKATVPSRPMVFGGGTIPGAVKLTLQGVDPNNIFWVSNTGVQISDLAHNLTGNFLGINRLTINGSTQQQLQGVRFLGFNTLIGDFPTAITTAMTDTKQPLLVPVLQLHSPKGRPSANTAAFGASTDHINDNWLPHAARTTFNAALIMGDSPSRPASSTDPRYKAEANGGLGNFPRFLEAWEPTDATPNDQKTIARISGSLIQFKKSEFATAPFQAIDDPARDTSLFFDGATPDYTSNYVNPDYRYKGGSSNRLAPYYRAPKRQWGYDVGFLSQTPDLFSRRFGTPSAGTPSEFYRAVGRDDAWVQTLLCAAEQTTQPGGAGTPPPAYDAYAISDPKQRPSCPTLPYAQPLS
jgi:hypothetical protein